MMNPSLQIALFSIVFLTCFAFTVRYLWQGHIHMLPSLGWLSLTCLPFCIEFPFFNSETRLTHGFAICFFLSVIFFCDLIAGWIKTIIPAPQLPEFQQRKQALMLGYALATLFIFVSATHLSFADNIPYLEALTKHHSDSQLITDRINFSRAYNGLPGMKYVYSFSIFIFGIPAFLILLKVRQWPAAAILLGWIALYSMSSTAKGPLITMSVITLIGICAIVPKAASIKFLRTLMVSGFAGFFILVVVDFWGPGLTSFKDLPQKYALERSNKNSDMMLGDYIRGIPREEYETKTPMIMRVADYYLYRIVLTPVEVSARWYEYFHRFPVTEKIISRSILDSRTHQRIHPANAVGRWAYYERYPNHYTQEAYAYASIDADAHGRFGLLGLLGAGLLYAFMRLWIGLCDDKNSLSYGIFGTIGAGMLALLPTSASIQALLLPQGLAMLMIIMSLLKAWEVWQLKRIRCQILNVAN